MATATVAATTGQKLRERYPNRVPVVLSSNSELRTTKFLLPTDMSAAQFLSVARRHINDVHKNEALFMTVGGRMPMLQQTVLELDRSHSGDDGILRVAVNKENTFG